MADVISTIGEGFKQSFLMAYEVWWALVIGFAISGIVQAWVPRARIESALAGTLHPNAEGHQQIADLIDPVLARVLKQ